MTTVTAGRMRLRPRDLVDLRTSLVRWHETDLARKMWFDQQRSVEPMKYVFPGSSDEELQAKFTGAIKASSLYLVDEQMTPLCVAAGESYRPARLSVEDLPAPFGLVVWNGNPISQTTSRDGEELQDIVAMSWGCAWGRVESTDNPFEPCWVITRAWEDRDGGTMPPGVPANARELNRHFLRRIVPLAESAFPISPRIESDPLLWTEGGYVEAERILFATLRLLQQRITAVSREPATRSDQRRAARAGVEASSDVSVVRLCAKDYQTDTHGSRNVEWDHRWVVSGHWRDQWYPSEGQHHQVWITPHIKGPENLPLVVKEKVGFFDRTR